MAVRMIVRLHLLLKFSNILLKFFHLLFESLDTLFGVRMLVTVMLRHRFSLCFVLHHRGICQKLLPSPNRT